MRVHQKIIKTIESMDSNASTRGMLVNDILVDIQSFATREASWVPRTINVALLFLLNMLVPFLMIVYGGTFL